MVASPEQKNISHARVPAKQKCPRVFDPHSVSKKRRARFVYLSRKGAALLLRLRVGLPEETKSVSPAEGAPQSVWYAPHTREPFKRATGTGNLLMNTEAESSPDAGPRCPSRDGTARIASAADRGRSSLFRAWINFHAAESEGHHYGASDIHAHMCPRSEMRVNEKNVEHWMAAAVLALDSAPRPR